MQYEYFASKVTYTVIPHIQLKCKFIPTSDTKYRQSFPM